MRIKRTEQDVKIEKRPFCSNLTYNWRLCAVSPEKKATSWIRCLTGVRAEEFVSQKVLGGPKGSSFFLSGPKLFCFFSWLRSEQRATLNGERFWTRQSWCELALCRISVGVEGGSAGQCYWYWYDCIARTECSNCCSRQLRSKRTRGGKRRLFAPVEWLMQVFIVKIVGVWMN